ncbi:LysE family transporter [Rhodobacterales bacterium HKCCE2091]|nr:LysE family transporter [Rhodobacterales bacterium HKCCE2091]
MELAQWLAFAGASTLLLLIPGPTVLLVLAYAAGEGRRIAVPTALGVATGDLVAMSASLAGLGALVLASATAFTVLKWIGAVYLVWLGLRMIRGASAMRLSADAKETALGPAEAFRNAAAVTALNPKSIAFFIAFVPQFVDPARAFAPQAAILVATFVALAAVNALAYALIAGTMRGAIRQPAVTTWLARGGGAALVGMGVATAALRRA